MSSSDRFSRIVTGTLAVCAVVATTLLVRREFIDHGGGSLEGAAPRPRILTPAEWSEYTSVGHDLGPKSAPITVLEFGDFECPACGGFERGGLKVVREKFPTQVRVIFRHWPLSYHRLAYPAARAAECASRQGRFEQFHDLLYRKQDSLGLKSFAAFATESGVPNLAAFETCNNASDKVAPVERDMEAVGRIGGHGTPTIIIEGKMLSSVPTAETFERLVVESLRQKGVNLDEISH